MNINSVGYNPQCNPQPCKQSPSFGAIRFTEKAMSTLKAQIINRVGNVDLFVKEVKPLISHAENNPIHVIVDAGKNIDNKLVAKVEDRKLNFGYDASTTYTQDDKYSFDFLANAVEKAEQLNKINKELDGISNSKI